jgi:dCMP deaminase
MVENANIWLDRALRQSDRSSDPNTRVGAIITDGNGNILSAGFNGFPPGIEQTKQRMNDREVKLSLIVHAECKAIALAAKLGKRLEGGVLYLACTDETGLIWGGPPCTRCTTHVIEAGIKRVISRPLKPVPSKWHADLEVARKLLEEAQISYEEIIMGQTTQSGWSYSP